MVRWGKRGWIAVQRAPCDALAGGREERVREGVCRARCSTTFFFFFFFFFTAAVELGLLLSADLRLLLPPIERDSMPHRRRRSAPNLLPALSLIAALVLSYPCAQGHAKQGRARPAVSSFSSAAAAPAALFSPSPNSPPPPSPPPPSLDNDDLPDLPSATASGYVPNGGPDRGGGQLFYTYYEKRNATQSPIFLWIEGGPGCASSFGNFYINGPARVLASRDEAEGGRRRATGKLKANPHAWNAVGGLLYIDQPVGTGFSVPGATGTIPRSEVEVAADLYFGLCELFGPGGPLEALAPRPLFVTGESYAGKFVPSIAHYILQVEAEAEEAKTRENRRERRAAGSAASASASASARRPPPLRVRRELRWERDPSTGALSPPRPPPFHLAGIAVVSNDASFIVSLGKREREKGREPKKRPER